MIQRNEEEPVVDIQQSILKEIGPKDENRYVFNYIDDILEVCMISDIGNRRTNNEDHCLFSKVENLNDTRERLGILTAVADGMGGAVAGEQASKMAVNSLCDYYFEAKGDNIPQILLDVIQRINEDIYNLGESDPSYFGMGTTLSALVIHGDVGYIAQVGDSRVYIYRDLNPVKQLTEDHSVVAEQLKEGLINEEEARNHFLKNIITRAIGIKEVVDTDLYCFNIKTGDTILLCSDGLSNMVSREEIQEGLSSEKLLDGLTFLVDKAIEEGAPDNITAVAIRIIGYLEHKEMISHKKMTYISLDKKASLLKRFLSFFTNKKDI